MQREILALQILKNPAKAKNVKGVGDTLSRLIVEANDQLELMKLPKQFERYIGQITEGHKMKVAKNMRIGVINKELKEGEKHKGKIELENLREELKILVKEVKSLGVEKGSVLEEMVESVGGRSFERQIESFVKSGGDKQFFDFAFDKEDGDKPIEGEQLKQLQIQQMEQRRVEKLGRKLGEGISPNRYLPDVRRGRANRRQKKHRTPVRFEFVNDEEAP